MVIAREIEISLPDGVTDGVLFHPEGAGSWPGVLYLTDIGGIRPAQRQAAERLSAEGYLVLMPNVFYRVSRPPVMNMGLRATPELFMKRVQELTKPLTPDAIERDAKGYVDFLVSQEAVQNNSKVGVVGFCFCGAVAMRVAAACPDQVAACASFHGGNLYEDGPSSPHLVLARVRVRLLFGHAVEDKSMPAEAIAGFEKALAAWRGDYESETYEGARHGWTTLDHPAYHAEQAERAYQKLKDLFAKTLPA